MYPARLSTVCSISRSFEARSAGSLRRSTGLRRIYLIVGDCRKAENVGGLAKAAADELAAQQPIVACEQVCQVLVRAAVGRDSARAICPDRSVRWRRCGGVRRDCGPCGSFAWFAYRLNKGHAQANSRSLLSAGRSHAPHDGTSRHGELSIARFREDGRSGLHPTMGLDGGSAMHRHRQRRRR
jgi:hypothetical protein